MDPPSRPGAALAHELMRAFARDTGLVGEGPPRRYLWTDAFAVCNFLGEHRELGDPEALALRLVDQVHEVLGRHRADDSRRGWISGLPAAAAEQHPTRGGLRIGKELPERGPEEPLEPRLEWDRDGQYFHYLTRWMHALRRVAEENGAPRYLRWARELAVAAHSGFVSAPPAGGRPRMRWKMSIDLSRALVPSMGHHDPLDALVTYLELQTSAPAAGHEESGPDLTAAIADAEAMCGAADWATEDPLGIGGLLIDSALLARLVVRRGAAQRPLLRRLLADALSSLQAFAAADPLRPPREHRLAFRELGLAIGLHAVAWTAPLAAADPEIGAAVERLHPWFPLAGRIEAAWIDPAARHSPAWQAHRDINSVMLATSLAPAGFLGQA
ncbi:MAG TPA: hypothetical protein VGV61_17330 [Thermoanaerobaculia bacterium]|jgi:hypothetical protein|nr:hypothetical protein [Thermoanaerobaculia bacterium]